MLKLKLLWISLVCFIHTVYPEGFEEYNYDETSWNDREEDWKSEQMKDGWSWDDIGIYNYAPNFHQMVVGPSAFPKYVEKLRQFESLHYDNLSNMTKNGGFGYPTKYNELTRDAIYNSQSFVIKLELYADLFTNLREWLVQAHFVPFLTPIPPKEIDEKDWILGPVNLWMLGKNELFAKINFRREQLFPQESPTKLYVSQLITVNKTSVSVLTRHFARYKDHEHPEYSPRLTKLPSEMDVTMTPWDEIDGTDGDPAMGSLKINLFRYPGPPSESDFFDLISKKEKETFRNYGTKLTKSDWLANQYLRQGLLKESPQLMFRTWDFITAMSTAEFTGCECMEKEWKPSRDPNESEKLFLAVLKQCRQKLYPQWFKLAVAARLSSCFGESPKTYGKVFPDVPKHSEL